MNVSGVTAAGLLIESSVIANNTLAGVAVFEGAGIILQNNAILGTRTEAVYGIGDGVHVRRLEGKGAPAVEIQGDNRISGNARAGVLFDSVETGIILKSEVSENGRGGVWLQGDVGTGEGVVLDSVLLSRNRYAGVTVTAGGRGSVLGSTVSETLEGSALDDLGGQVKVADGIGVFAGSSARIEANTIGGSQRAGVLLNGARQEGTTVFGNTVSGNRVGIILQHPQPAGGVTLGANEATDNPEGDVVTEPATPLKLDPLAEHGLLVAPR